MLVLTGTRASSKSVWAYAEGGGAAPTWSADTGANTLGNFQDWDGNVFAFGISSGSKNLWKYNSSGVLQDSKYLAPAGSGQVSFTGIEDRTGRVIVGTTAYLGDFFVRLSADFLTMERFAELAGGASGNGGSVDIDPSGNIYVVGNSQENLTAYRAKYNSSLVLQWGPLSTAITDSWPNYRVIYNSDDTLTIAYDMAAGATWYRIDVSDGSILGTGTVADTLVGCGVDNDGNTWISTDAPKLRKETYSGGTWTNALDVVPTEIFTFFGLSTTGILHASTQGAATDPSYTINTTTGADTANATGIPAAPFGASLTTTDTSPKNPADRKYTRKLVTFAYNKVYYGADPDTMTELSAADGDIDVTKRLSAVAAYGKVFVANEDTFKVADFVNVKITTGTLGVVPNHGNILTGGTSGAKMVCDYITTITGACVLYGNLITSATFQNSETVTGTNDAGGSISFTTNAAQATGPFWYDWTVYGGDTTTYGDMPTNSDLVKLHIGCVWLMGNAQYPHQWYKTRQNNPWDFLYAQNDAGSAVAGNNTDAGEVGDIIVDAVSYSDDYMVFGCSGELHAMLGNPAAGGRINKIRDTGLLAPRAWCWDNDQNLFLLSTEGLLMIPKGFGPVENITKESYPDLIKDLAYNSSTHRMAMAYDSVNKGIIMSRVTVSNGVNQCYFLSLRSGGFFPETYPEEASFSSLLQFEADDPADKGLLIGSNDGYIRKWDPTAKSDDIGDTDEAIDAYVAFGPMRTSSTARNAKRISGIDVVTGGDGDGGASDSSAVYCKVHAGRVAEKIITNMVAGSGQAYTKTFQVPGWKKGNVDRHKVRGRWVGFVIGNNTAAQSFAIEEINFNVI